MNFKCTCHNSGTNSFTGKCSNCGMTKLNKGTTLSNSLTPFLTIHENKVMINPPQCKNGKQCFCDGSCKKPQEEFFILNAGSINCRPFTEEEKKELEETKKAFYEKYNSKNFEYKEEDYIKKLIESIPNDQELGAEIRKLLS